MKTLRNAITHHNSLFPELAPKDQDRIKNLISTVGEDKIYVDEQKRIILTLDFCMKTYDIVKNFFNKLYSLGFKNFPDNK